MLCIICEHVSGPLHWNFSWIDGIHGDYHESQSGLHRISLSQVWFLLLLSSSHYWQSQMVSNQSITLLNMLHWLHYGSEKVWVMLECRAYYKAMCSGVRSQSRVARQAEGSGISYGVASVLPNHIAKWRRETDSVCRYLPVLQQKSLPLPEVPNVEMGTGMLMPSSTRTDCYPVGSSGSQGGSQVLLTQ